MKQSTQRTLGGPNGILLLLLVATVVLCALFLWWQKSTQKEGAVAKVWLDGQVVMTFSLQDYEESTLVDLEETTGKHAKVELKDHQIRFTQVQCPDHICEGYGFLSQVGQTAVCMPNRLVITIEES